MSGQLGIVNYKQGSYVVVEGKQKADCFFIIQQGKVRITREVAIDGERDELLVPGDFFGVISAMSSQSHIETALAATDVVLITVPPHQYVGLLQKNSQIAVKILTLLSSRLRFLDRAHTRLSIKDGANAILLYGPHRLFNVAEYYFSQELYNQAFYAYTKYLKYCPDGEDIDAARKRLEEMADRAGNVRTEFEKNELERAYRKDDMLFAEGELGDELFVIQRGSVKITKIIEGKEVLLVTLKAGDTFGEMAVLEGKPRAANALAAENCAVMAVNKTSFKLLIKDQPQLVSRITTLLAERIWFVFKQLEITLIINPLGRVYGALLIQFEKNWVNLNSSGPYTFSFTWDDLAHMLGFNEKESYLLMDELQQKDKNIQVKNGTIHASSIQAVVRQTEYYRKMDRIAKAKQESRSKMMYSET